MQVYKKRRTEPFLFNPTKIFLKIVQQIRPEDKPSKQRMDCLKLCAVLGLVAFFAHLSCACSGSSDGSRPHDVDTSRGRRGLYYKSADTSEETRGIEGGALSDLFFKNSRVRITLDDGSQYLLYKVSKNSGERDSGKPPVKNEKSNGNSRKSTKGEPSVLDSSSEN